MKVKLILLLLFVVVLIGLTTCGPLIPVPEVVVSTATVQPTALPTETPTEIPTETPTVAPTEVPAQVIDVKDTWDLAAIYADEAAWESDFQLVMDTYIPEYQKYEGKLGDAEQLAKLMEMDEKASRTMDKLYVYAYMLRDSDNTNSKISEMADRSGSLWSDLSTAYSYVRPELIALDQAVLESYIKDERFANYAIFLRYLLEEKAHTLSPAEEKLLAMSGDMSSAPETIYTKITEADLTFPTVTDPDGNEIELSEGVFGDLLSNPNRDFRQEVYTKLMETYGGMQNSLAAALDAQMRKDIFYAQTRNYETALDASLQSNYVPREVYSALITATNANLGSLQRYVSLRKRVMGLDKVRTYDLFVPLVEGQEVNIPYQEAQTKLAEALAPLGDQYIADMKKAFESRWIDVYENPNKSSGAYSWGTYDTHPYILTNYTDSLDSMLTLGHEMGHALNSYYTNQSQAYINSNIATFNAEVASTTNEMLVLRYLVKTASSDEEKLYYLDRLAETIRGTFFTQVMFAEFEQQIHDRVEQGDALSVDSLNEMWGNLLVKYYGADYELIDAAKLGWSRVPHFYYNFYVYQYATGIAAADQFSLELSENKAGVVDKYLTYLKAGGSDDPVVVLNTAGVDMLSGQPVSTLLSDFDNTVAEMEKLLIKLGKIK